MATAAFLMSDDRSEASLFALDLELLFGAVEADDVVAVVVLAVVVDVDVDGASEAPPTDVI